MDKDNTIYLTSSEITDYLDHKGFKHSRKGFKYLVRLIQEVGRNPILVEKSQMKRNTYTELAEEFNTERHMVEQAINHSIRTATFLVDLEMLGEGRPRVVDFVAKAIYDLNKQREFEGRECCFRCVYYTMPSHKQLCYKCKHNYHSQFESRE